jgi:hypothetical protein
MKSCSWLRTPIFASATARAGLVLRRETGWLARAADRPEDRSCPSGYSATQTFRRWLVCAGYVVLAGFTSFAVRTALLAAPGGGVVLAPNQTPSGFALEDMARALAYFSTSGNDRAYYPDTPFQVLYVQDPTTGTGRFDVGQDTKLFVPVAYADDSPQVLGDFPADEDRAKEYVFGRHELGGHDLEIEVDGRVTTIGPGYVAGPVFAPGLLDGGGSHYLQIGAFLSPLSPGTHTVKIRGIFDGAALAGVFLGGVDSFENTYTVTVRKRPSGPRAAAGASGLAVTSPIQIHVNSVYAGSFEVNGKPTKVRGSVRVGIVDASGNPVAGALVQGKWTGIGNGTSSGTTDSSGFVLLTSPNTANCLGTQNMKLPWTFTITDVSLSGAIYDPSQNAASSGSTVGCI